MQKTILERKGPPTFTCAVEMISKTECRVHHRLDATVDAILGGSLLFSLTSKLISQPCHVKFIVSSPAVNCRSNVSCNSLSNGVCLLRQTWI